MSSYFVTGVSRGIGFEFLRQLSSDPAKTVIGLVRNKPATDAKVAALNRTNIHILEGDLTDYESLKRAASATSKITGGSLDYLIANAASIPLWSYFDGMGALGSKDPVALEKDLLDAYKTNIIGNVHLFNLFLPLILKGEKKKVIAISSGMADIELITKYDLEIGGPYAVSKAGANAVVAKYSAEYAKDGVLFISICPGVVDTGNSGTLTEEQLQKIGVMMGKFAQYAPNFKGPATPEESVKALISVYEKASVAGGDGGAFVSHFGNKQWL
ncbi:hypothetical protein A1O3_03136 [Capronia epimyces CBS 606.96]|uniref:NAD(P)-binding protein n=1 Tax=Capronia epimyces CBS 606.96 TaxID=1182542 RepID=W9YC19_9EURO|nr:uncharacterized protein A1O3_03136 [Capronia epimyces CBS 606.96]EXJ90068.1 hypothetical protein A1O3_03136 [Capronia epimyces CBS 606.96]